jgi:hypothetical protein
MGIKGKKEVRKIFFFALKAIGKVLIGFHSTNSDIIFYLLLQRIFLLNVVGDAGKFVGNMEILSGIWKRILKMGEDI